MSSRRRKSEKDSRDWVFGLYNNRSKNKRASTPPLRGKGAKESSSSRLFLNRWVIGVVLVFLILWIPYVDIDCTTQKNTSCKGLEVYKDSVSAASPLFLRIYPLFDSAGLENELAQNPYVHSAELSRGLLNIVSVDIVERSTFGVWHSEDNPDSLVAVDRYGVGYSDVTIIDVGQIEIIDSVNITPELGSALVETDVMNYLLEMDKNNMLPGYLIDHAKITEAIREFSVVLTELDSSRDIEVKMSTLRPLEHQIIDFRLTVNYLEEQGRTASYVDVRLESSTSYR